MPDELHLTEANLPELRDKLLAEMLRSTQRFWTRKDVSRILEISPDSVSFNEARLGLLPARLQINPRVFRYRTSLAIKALRKLKADLDPFPKGEPLSRHILKTAAANMLLSDK